MREGKKNKNGSGVKDGLRHLETETPGVSSATDYTGLIPADPKSREEREAYEDIHDFTNEPRR